jgi:hypothetical protein
MQPKLKKIRILTEIEDIYNDCVFVSVGLTDGFSYEVLVATPEYLLSSMKAKNQNFLDPGENFIVVNQLTPKIIKEAIISFIDTDYAYWLKFLHVSSYGQFDIESLDYLRDEILRRYPIDDDID